MRPLCFLTCEDVIGWIEHTFHQKGISKGNFIVLEAAIPILLTWQNFYVIIGTAAATLTGLMFVAVTLAVGRLNRMPDEANAAFATPTVVHVGAALLIAAILSAPWQALWSITLLLGLVGLSGVIYSVIIARRLRRQVSNPASYTPVMEDWIWHTVLPLVAYTALLIAAIALPVNASPPLFIIGAVMVLLLFIGIHNSWDTVTYLAVQLPQRENKSEKQEDSTNMAQKNRATLS